MEESCVLSPDPVAERHYFHNIGAKRSEETAKNVERRTENDNSQQQQKRENYIELAKTFDTDINTSHHRNQCNCCNEYNQKHHREAVRRYPKQIVKSGGYLLYPQTEGGRESEDTCEYGEGINDMSGPTPYPIAEYGIKRRTDQKW